MRFIMLKSALSYSRKRIKGVTSIEYAVIMLLVAATIFLSLNLVGINILNTFENLANSISPPGLSNPTAANFIPNCQGSGEGCYLNSQGVSIWAYYADPFSNYNQSTSPTYFAENAAASVQIYTAGTGVVIPDGTVGVPIPPNNIFQTFATNFIPSQQPFWDVSDNSVNSTTWTTAEANQMSQACA